MGKNKKRRGLTFGIFFVFTIFSFSQTKISGRIFDTLNLGLPSISVVIKDSLNKSIISYTYSNQNGNYSIDFDNIGKFKLIFSSLGYETKIVLITIPPSPKSQNFDIILKEQPLELDEVLIKPDRPITVSMDTIRVKTKFFADGTEQTVEDLLKKIPGLNIDTEGTIKVGNQEIEKLMVDGDDLFEKGYKILSKNMPAYPIEEVEILKRYSNNRLLKGIEESNKVALNLKLNEDSKRIWFGNVELGYGNADFYQVKGNLMNFGKKNKYYFLANGNTIGYDATGDIQSLIRPFRYNEPTSIGDNQSVSDLLSLSAGNLSFKRSRTNFNNAELLSLNAIFNPTEKLKL